MTSAEKVNEWVTQNFGIEFYTDAEFLFGKGNEIMPKLYKLYQKGYDDGHLDTLALRAEVEGLKAALAAKMDVNVTVNKKSLI